MSGILNGGPAMGPFRLMYMTRDGVSWMKYPMDSTFLVTLVIEHHGKQKSHDILPGGPARKKSRQSALQVGSAERPCLRQLRLRAGGVTVDELSSHVGVLDGRGKLPSPQLLANKKRALHAFLIRRWGRHQRWASLHPPSTASSHCDG